MKKFMKQVVVLLIKSDLPWGLDPTWFFFTPLTRWGALLSSVGYLFSRSFFDLCQIRCQLASRHRFQGF